MDTEKKLALIRTLIDNVAEDFSEEDILHMMLEKKITGDILSAGEKKVTFGQKAADRIAHFAGRTEKSTCRSKCFFMKTITISDTF